MALALIAMGREITGIVRSGQSADVLRAQGIKALMLDMDAVLPPVERGAIFYFAPPPTRGNTDPRLRSFLAALTAVPQRFVYISTSGVYGDCAGRWIDEGEPLKPISERAKRRLDAEQALHDYAQRSGAHTVILRVPGIYGPGRLPVERLRQNLPVIRAEQSPYTNRIHADDLAMAALHAAAYGAAGAAYNISDGNPTTMCDYFTRCAALLGLPPPPQVTVDEARRVFTPAMWSFMEESKRLRNQRMLEQLRYTPQYADLEAGLPSCMLF